MPRPASDYPRADHWWVRSLRFINVLDDDENKLSPTKINVWAANLGAFSTGLALVAGFFGAHVQVVESAWEGMVAWLGAAHAAHQFDKRRKPNVRDTDQ